METIYRSARCVVVVVEDPQVDEGGAHTLDTLPILAVESVGPELRYVSGRLKEHSSAPVSDCHITLVRGLLRRVVRSRWGRLAWCSHESILASSIRILALGSRSLDYTLVGSDSSSGI